MAAFRTGAMAGCQGRRFVQEEQLGVASWHHDPALAAPEFQHADDPPLQLPGPPDAPFGVVEDAPFAQERAPVRIGDNVAERGDTVLPRHLQPPTRLTR